MVGPTLKEGSRSGQLRPNGGALAEPFSSSEAALNPNLNNLRQPAPPQPPSLLEALSRATLSKSKTPAIAADALEQAYRELRDRVTFAKNLLTTAPEGARKEIAHFLSQAEITVNTIQPFVTGLESERGKAIVAQINSYNQRALTTGATSTLSPEAVQYLTALRATGALVRGWDSVRVVADNEAKIGATPVAQRAVESLVGDMPRNIQRSLERGLYAAHLQEDLIPHAAEMVKQFQAAAQSREISPEQQGDYIRSANMADRVIAWRFGEANLARVRGEMERRRNTAIANLDAAPEAAATLGAAAIAPFIAPALPLLTAASWQALAAETVLATLGGFSLSFASHVVEDGKQLNGTPAQIMMRAARSGVKDGVTTGVVTGLTGGTALFAPRAVSHLTQFGVSRETALFGTSTLLSAAVGGTRSTLYGGSEREVIGGVALSALSGGAASLCRGGVVGLGAQIGVQSFLAISMASAREENLSPGRVIANALDLGPGIAIGMGARRAPVVPTQSPPSNGFSILPRVFPNPLEPQPAAFGPGITVSASAVERPAIWAAKEKDGARVLTALNVFRRGEPGFKQREGVQGNRAAESNPTLEFEDLSESSGAPTQVRKKLEELADRPDVKNSIDRVIGDLKTGANNHSPHKNNQAGGCWEVRAGRYGRILFLLHERDGVRKVTILAKYAVEKHGKGGSNKPQSKFFETVSRWLDEL